MEANSAPTEFMPPQVTSLIPGGVVRYVGAGGTPLYDAPEGADQNSSSRGSLLCYQMETGDELQTAISFR